MVVGVPVFGVQVCGGLSGHWHHPIQAGSMPGQLGPELVQPAANAQRASEVRRAVRINVSVFMALLQLVMRSYQGAVSE